MSADYRTVSGKILYSYDDVGETGREWFTVTTDGNGDRILRARCEMDPDRVLRDVIYAVDKNWRPLDAYVRLTVEGKFLGQCWASWSETHITMHGTRAKDGAFTQSLEVPEWPRRFGSHALINDGWTCAIFDPAGPDVQHFEKLTSMSHAANGATGPELDYFNVTLARRAPEPMTTAAGTFDCVCFDITYGDHIPIRVWLRREDLLLVRMRWELTGGTYDLVELSES
jgi:hypothetical protein